MSNLETQLVSKNSLRLYEKNLERNQTQKGRDPHPGNTGINNNNNNNRRRKRRIKNIECLRRFIICYLLLVYSYFELF